MRFRTIAFEISLKPFGDSSSQTREAVCRRLFTQWLALTRHADGLSVLLWASDGSEILDYRGSLEASFEWACWQGVANPRRPYHGDRPGAASIHELPRLYRESPPAFTYGWLSDLVVDLRRIGMEVTGCPVRVGATFDPGPEFAVSDFKYRRHPEICMGDTMGQGSMVCCYATLNADSTPYAGFPDGIPAGTTMGTFLGRQAHHFLMDLGFDYLWLSNGFGFGLETWGLTGAVFDGSSFSGDRCEEVRQKSLGFWRDFRRECPDIPVQTRGTNLSTGMDLSSDAVPLRDIYRHVDGLLPPPNSPWAALNGDFGLELVGWMSHIADIPADRYPFRFYTHDPWFLNSPWLDRYRREPHDIYLPLTVSRLDAQGQIQCPTDLAFLSVDDSWGRMPDQVPNEVIPHILWAREHAPDAVAPFVWVYPFDEYHDRTFGPVQRIDEVFFGDWFMRGAVNHGFPLNTVVSSANLAKILADEPRRLQGTVLVTPVPDAGSGMVQHLADWVSGGGDLLVYGPVRRAPGWLLQRIDLELADPLEGDFTLQSAASPGFGDYGQIVKHHGLLSAGGIAAAPGERNGCEQLILRQGASRRVAASCSADGTGRVVWVRGTVSCDPEKLSGHLLVPYSDRCIFPAEALMRWASARFGWTFHHGGGDGHASGPLVCVSRYRNAFMIAGHQPDSTLSLGIRTPFGIPLLTDAEVRISQGMGWYHLPHAWLKECRVFVTQQSSGTVRCRTRRSGFPAVSRRLEVTGLEQATVVFFPETGGAGTPIVTSNEPVPCLRSEPLQSEVGRTARGDYLTVNNASGQIMISW